jgi:hypothetical protein
VTKQSTVKEFNREKMIEQNQKMKKQILELAQHMEEIVGKNQKKKKYGLNLDQGLDSNTMSKKMETQKQEAKIAELKS